MRKLLTMFLAFGLLAIVLPALADQSLGQDRHNQLRIGDHRDFDSNINVTANMLDDKEDKFNNASYEVTETVSGSGTLIEIGNTTAENTTIIIRTINANGVTSDQTFEVDHNTKLATYNGSHADLSDWIAGDPINFTAKHSINSDSLTATRLTNTAFKPEHKGINGWITAVHTDTNKIDVQWGNDILTLNLANAKMVAGTVNPANINDFEVGDRIRARVTDDSDGNRLTWNANIVVVLRRGNDLFMRVTRWVVPATITHIPQNLTMPITIEVSVNDSKFYEKNDVNNLIGAPGTKVSIDISSDTVLVRKYYGKALLSELSEGDTVRIIGRRDEATGHLVARVIKDDSIQQIGVAHRFGSVTSINNSNQSFTVTLFRTDNPDKNWTISTNSGTIIYLNGVRGNWSDLQVGDAIRIRGTANLSLKTITATTVAILTE